jgi:DNA modification methylase
VNRVILGNCIEVLKTLEAGSVQCCVTSPPYYGLRDYGVDGQIGLEETPEAYVDKLVDVFREVWRVMANDGTLWLNLGDSYAGGGNYRGVNSEATLSEKQRSNGGARGVSQLLGAKNTPGCKPKDLIGIPWMVAFALRADGWYLRSDIIWHKPNPMPESVTDRPTKSHEYIFLLSKSAAYYCNMEAIQEPAGPIKMPGNGSKADHPDRRDIKDYAERTREKYKNLQPDGQQPHSFHLARANGESDEAYTSRNKRDVWTVATKPYTGAHFATFPPDLIEPCILAGSREGDTVLDPFNGSGTTGAVSIKHHRNYIGIELNPAYVELTNKRFASVQPVLFPQVLP